MIVFLSRYTDLLWDLPAMLLWNKTLKFFYLLSSGYTLVLMLRIYPRSREREKAWRLAVYALVGSILASLVSTAIFEFHKLSQPFEVIYNFSLALESVCVLPQLLLLRQTTVPTVITSVYLVTLGSYRFFYILNWIVRAAGSEHHFDPITVIFGIIQTALYLDFAWVYWTRQRVKLRSGGLVDSDDLRKSFLVGNLLGGSSRFGAAVGHRRIINEDDDDVEEAPGGSGRGNAAATESQNSSGNHLHDQPPLHSSLSNKIMSPGAGGSNHNKNKWGRRGISVRADDTLDQIDQQSSSVSDSTSWRRQQQQQQTAMSKGGKEEPYAIGRDRTTNIGVQPSEVFEVGDGEPDEDEDEDEDQNEDKVQVPVPGEEANMGMLNSERAWQAGKMRE